MSDPNNSKQQKDDKKNQQSFTQAFKQQVMKAWQPVPTINSTIILFLILTIFFLTFGIILVIYSNDVKEYSTQYNNISECQTTWDTYKKNKEDFEKANPTTPYTPQASDYCQIVIELEDDFKETVFVYYELDNFYQNHRRYVKSRNVDQLQGEDVKKSNLDDCDPIKTNEEAQQKFSYAGKKLDPKAAAIPCGLIAKSFFTDEFRFRKYEDKSDFSKTIPISDKGIAWPSDKEHKFKNPKNSESTAWIDLDNNERFMVWMRTAALPYFRKLWGRVEQDMPKGKYIVDILNIYDVEQFDGKKSLVISTANTFGGKNNFLAIAYLVVGGVCLVITLAFIIKKCVNKKHKPE